MKTATFFVYIKKEATIQMIVILKQNTTDTQMKSFTGWLASQGLDVHISKGNYETVVGLIGDTSKVDEELIKSLEMVESVRRISDPFKSANRKFHPDDSTVQVTENAVFGAGHFGVIAGPCSVETEEQIISVAQSVKDAGAAMLRGGAFKPRTSPYDFQGLGSQGIELLLKAKKATGLPIITEILSTAHLSLFEEVDVIQVGARNMQNFELLKHLGKTNKPILLKRGLSNTLEELLMSAEYIMSEGNEKVILCERGIRTFETATRNTLDISAIPMLHSMTHLPVVIDPSHATGKAMAVPSMSLAGVVAGADGLIIEVHNNPAKALCDGAQSLTPAQFDELYKKIESVKPFSYRV